MKARAGAPALAGLLLLAGILRLYDLNSQLWFDEISAITNSIRRPLADVMRWSGPANHALFETLSHLSIRVLGESPFAARLPAALFGIAGVWALYTLVSTFLEQRHAWTIAGLFAVSYHHVFFSQNARGYTALIFFFLVATRVAVRCYDAGRLTLRHGTTYAGAGVLAAYSQFSGVAIVPAQLAAMAGAWVLARRQRAFMALRQFALAAAAAMVLTAALFAPYGTRIITAAQRNAASAAEGPRLGWGLLMELAEGLSAAFLGPLGLLAALAVGVVGAVVWWRRHPFSFVVAVAPIVLQLLVYAVLGIGVHPRYLVLALPVGFIVGGAGLVTVTSAAAARVTGARSRALEYALLCGIVLLAATPLRAYYRTPKQDFLGAVAIVEGRAAPGDARVAVHLVDRAINGYYDRGWLRADNLQELVDIERRGGRIFVVTTLERILEADDAALAAHVRTQYRRIASLPGTVGGGTVHIYARDRSLR